MQEILSCYFLNDYGLSLLQTPWSELQIQVGHHLLNIPDCLVSHSPVNPSSPESHKEGSGAPGLEN